jgi:hypothetical protein
MALLSGLPVPQWESPGDRSAQAVQGNQQRLQMFQQSRMRAMDRQAELNDPFRELKALQILTQMKANAAQLAESELSRRIKENTIDSEAADKLAFTNLITSAQGDEDKLLEGLANTQFMSPMGRDSATQMRLAAVARKSRDAFSKALSKLTPQGIARVSQFEAGSPEAWKAIQEEDVLNKPTSTLGKILSDRAAAKAAGRDDEVAIFDAEISARGAKDGFSIQFDDQNKPIINYGPQTGELGKITVATQSRVQQKLLKYEGVSQLLNTLEKNMKPEHLGARGVAGELLLDRGLSQFIPELANKDRIDTRTGLVVARESLMRDVSDDTRFSNADREEIARALPSSGVFESVEDAKQRIQTVRRILTQRGKISAEGTGLPVQLWTQTPDEIKALYRDKKISENDAIDALRRFH